MQVSNYLQKMWKILCSLLSILLITFKEICLLLIVGIRFPDHDPF